MSDSELLNQIATLAGAINRHKNNEQRTASSTISSHPYQSFAPRGRSTYRGVRGRGRASSYRGMKSISHRNRTLVLNGPSLNETVVDAIDSTLSTASPNSGADTPSNSTGPTYVKKRDRHMQLINSTVYSDLALARTKAIEATRVAREEKRALRAQREAAKARRVARLEEVEIDGVKYRVQKDGSKLIRVTADNSNANHAPKKAVIGGVTFLRSKNGNLWRKGVVKSMKRERKSIDEHCRYFTMTGKCGRGLSCPYKHDPNHVALCPLYLHNKCQNPSCDLSHTPSPHNSPLCVHFQRGHCSNPDCKYTHMTVAPGAKVCRDFALKLYCDAGDKCTGRHVFECPDFEETGTCPRGEKKCKLMHVFRAGKNKHLHGSGGGEGDAVVFTDEGGNGEHSELPADVLQGVMAHLQRDDEIQKNRNIISLYSDAEEDDEEDENDEDEGEDEEDDVEFDSDMFEEDDVENEISDDIEPMVDDGGQEYIPL
ncbi:uncharacterized protein V1513DRAFT_442597 [Lipomyces chichibuensis]|uniref:uncharacterized protein n=1 Tax=Lipomyces chichibuensis TaxID=1546026 RepID=UPI003343B1B8